MSELEFFAAALQITDAGQRSAYLDRVCGSDAALRQRLEVLLRNHEQAGSFLQIPAAPLLGAALLAGQDATQTLAHHQHGEAIVAAHQRESETATQGEPGDDESDQSVLDFLQPSSKPGALGRLGHYEVMEVLGQGGFGTVVRAFDEKLHRMVAIKIMSPQLAATSPARKRFIREARSSAAIRHENVVDIHAIEERPIPFLVMEYVAGETLQQRLDRTGPLDPADVLRIGVQIAQGLIAAHAMGKIHRDIKPANILLENGVDRVKITDFGLARAADDASLTQSGFIAGTPMYMAPEQAQGVALDHRADLFSFGSVLYVMCSGRPPFRAMTTLAVLKRVTEDTPRPIREIIPEVPAWLCDLISKLHAKKPEDRFQSAQEVADRLAKYLTGLQLHGKAHHKSEVWGPDSEVEKPLTPVVLPAGGTTRITTRPSRRKQLLLVGATVLLLPLLGLSLTEAVGVTTLCSMVGDRFTPQVALPMPPHLDPVIHPDRKVVEQVPPPGEKVKEKEPDPKPKLVPPTFSADPDRRGAEYVLWVGGSVTVRVNNKEPTILAGGELPHGLFELKFVNMTENQNVSDAGLANLKDCRSIRILNLGDTKVTDAGLAHLRDWQMLLGLDLTGTKVGDAGLAHFQNHRFLTNLNLSATDVTDVGLAYLNKCKSLQSIILGGTKVSDTGLAQFKDCKNLARVGLAGTKVSDEGLAYLKDCPNLATLELSGTGIDDAGLVHLKDCQNLIYLDLANTQVSAAGLAHLVGFPKPLWLNVKNTKVTEAGVKQFAATVPTCMIEWDGGVIEPTLNPDPDRRAAEWLLANPKGRLVHTFADGKELPAYHLSYLPKASFELRRLNLDRNPKVSDETLTMLNGLRHLTHLQISHVKVTDAALAHLKDCKQLRELQLPGTSVTDTGVARLAGLPGLLYLNLKQTAVTEPALKKLAAALPKCKIEWDGGVFEPAVTQTKEVSLIPWGSKVNQRGSELVR